MILAMLRAFFLGAFGCCVVIIVLWKLVGLALGGEIADSHDRIRREIAQTETPDYEPKGYDNSDYLRDVEQIKRGTYVDSHPEAEDSE
jgi:hypothetical protein